MHHGNGSGLRIRSIKENHGADGSHGADEKEHGDLKYCRQADGKGHAAESAPDGHVKAGADRFKFRIQLSDRGNGSQMAHGIEMHYGVKHQNGERAVDDPKGIGGGIEENDVCQTKDKARNSQGDGRQKAKWRRKHSITGAAFKAIGQNEDKGRSDDGGEKTELD